MTTYWLRIKRTARKIIKWYGSSARICIWIPHANEIEVRKQSVLRRVGEEWEVSWPPTSPKWCKISAYSCFCLEYSISFLEISNSFSGTQDRPLLYLSIITLLDLPVWVLPPRYSYNKQLWVLTVCLASPRHRGCSSVPTSPKSLSACKPRCLCVCRDGGGDVKISSDSSTMCMHACVYMGTCVGGVCTCVHTCARVCVHVCAYSEPYIYKCYGEQQGLKGLGSI